MYLERDRETNRQQDWHHHMQHLAKIAPNMALKDAVCLTNSMVVENEKVRELTDILFILSVDVCGFYPDGHLRDGEVKEKAREHPRLLMALNKASGMHAHWATGASPGVQWALDQLDKRAVQLKQEGKLPDFLLEADRG